MDGEKQPVILASQSPRRLELMRQLAIPFVVQSADVDETCEGLPEDQVRDIALRKALAVQAIYPGRVILAADTLVQHNEKTLGKPISPQEAEAMLEELSGDWHQVYTGVCLLDGERNRKQVAVEKTDVLFSALSKELIEKYVETGEPLDKAGAYAIQGHGGMLVEEVRGSYSNVIGLPLALVRKMLAAFDIDVFSDRE